MNNKRGLDVIATTISGSVRDGSKIPRIRPLFEKYFPGEVRVHVVDSHAAARDAALAAVRSGSRLLVSAGGGGTFNRVMQGILDSGAPLDDIRLGFLRKGSADLIGKALGVPDEVEAAVRAISNGIAQDRVAACDVINARDAGRGGEERNLVGFGGVGVVGDIPYFTDSPLTKYYKAILGTLFGDIGPFRVGTALALSLHAARKLAGRGRRLRLVVDGRELPGDRYLSVLLVNGDLGPDMPFARGCGLGTGSFHLVALRDLGLAKIPGQLAGSFDGSISEDPQRWGLELRVIERDLSVIPEDDRARAYRVNVDGLPWQARGPLSFRVRGTLQLIKAVDSCRALGLTQK